MAEHDDDMPNFDNLMLPDDDLEAIGDVTPISEEEIASSFESDAAEPVAQKPAKVQEPEKPASVVAPGPQKQKTRNYTEWAVVFGMIAALLGLGAVGLIGIATAVYLLVVAFVPYTLWKSRQTNSVYTIILGCALVAILTAVFFFWIELSRYNFDIKARSVKGPVVMAESIDRFPMV